MLLRIHQQAGGDLPLIVQATRLVGLLPRLREDRKENGCQNGDDRHYDK
jgi:hypothetical protein